MDLGIILVPKEFLDAIAKGESFCSDNCYTILETAKENLIGNNLYIKTGFALDVDHNFYSWDISK